MSRKQELNKRANRVGEARKEEWLNDDTSHLPTIFAHTFEQGYRAAMRDARKAYHSKRIISERCDALIAWLRPLK